MSTSLLRLCLLSLAFVTLVSSCGFPTGMGGMCGGGCAPPPMSCGGGCGRKKREAVDAVVPQLNTEEKNACAQTTWLPILQSALGDDAASSAHAAQGALYKKFGARFNVLCAPKAAATGRSFVANGDGYCSVENERLWCHATVLWA